MKRLKFKNFFYTLLVLGFIIPATLSCDKDDDFEITGTWNIDKIEVFMGGELIEEFSETNAGTVTFNANGTGSTTDFEGTHSFTWSLSGDKLTVTDEDGPVAMTLTTMEPKRMVAEFKETWENMTLDFVMTLSKN
jgi:hypothetical protein